MCIKKTPLLLENWREGGGGLRLKERRGRESGREERGKDGIKRYDGGREKETQEEGNKREDRGGRERVMERERRIMKRGRRKS